MLLPYCSHAYNHIALLTQSVRYKVNKLVCDPYTCISTINIETSKMCATWKLKNVFYKHIKHPVLFACQGILAYNIHEMKTYEIIFVLV